MIEAPTDSQNVHALYGETMGTRWRVCVVGRTSLDLHALHAAIQMRLDDVVAQMSTWQPHSDISRFNAAQAGTWHVLPDAFDQVLSCALEVAEASGGAYDPTIGPLVALWGFGAHAGAQRVPDRDAIAAASKRVGWQRILRRPASRAVLQPGGAMLDLSAIAKGYGVDTVAELLRSRGILAALVDIGGELYGHGRKPDGAPWRVLVESVLDGDALDDGALEGVDRDASCVLALDDVAVATSGDRWHSFEQDGLRYAHTLDPRRGTPVAHAPASVTVIHRSAMLADAWATALTVMGRDAGLAFAEKNALAVRFAERNTEGIDVRMSSSFETWLAATR